MYIYIFFGGSNNEGGGGSVGATVPESISLAAMVERHYSVSIAVQKPPETPTPPHILTCLFINGKGDIIQPLHPHVSTDAATGQICFVHSGRVDHIKI